MLGYIVGQKGTHKITDSLEDLAQVARHFCETEIEYLAVNGGDGTVSQTLSAMIREYGDKPLPIIVVLGGGTMNVLSLNLGIRKKPEMILSELVHNLSLNNPLKTKELASIKIGNRYGFLYADGTSALILEDFYKRKTGYLGGAILGVRVVLSALFRTPLAKRLIRGRPIIFAPKPGNALTHYSLGTYASSLARLPMQLPMFGKKLMEGQVFRGISISLKPEELLFKFPFIAFFTKPGHYKGKHNFNCKALEITCEEPFRYTLDGELFTAEDGKVHIEVGPMIRFLLPGD